MMTDKKIVLNERQQEHLNCTADKLSRLGRKITGIVALLNNQGEDPTPNGEELGHLGLVLEDYAAEISRLAGGIELGPLIGIGEGARKSEKEKDEIVSGE